MQKSCDVLTLPLHGQCEEEALAALVKTRCVLDNFEAALEMLANDKISPDSIEPWTLDQVRYPSSPSLWESAC